MLLDVMAMIVATKRGRERDMFMFPVLSERSRKSFRLFSQQGADWI